MKTRRAVQINNVEIVKTWNVLDDSLVFQISLSVWRHGSYIEWMLSYVIFAKKCVTMLNDTKTRFEGLTQSIYHWTIYST